MSKQKYNIRCDVCGRFISIADLEKGFATRQLITPDSYFSREEYETLCISHSINKTLQKLEHDDGLEIFESLVRSSLHTPSNKPSNEDLLDYLVVDEETDSVEKRVRINALVDFISHIEEANQSAYEYMEGADYEDFIYFEEAFILTGNLLEQLRKQLEQKQN